ncbi:hypothetical protein PPEP_a4548 [Pseudoalteromonas peptidolytica F12-50-A1]|uniref:Uncharacterized protein n=1 Tax=Pseudoalteromonas peptidolytica F12-50-A1 TaxID=1315280 RepID=A0A8I0MZU9_9GAMM|nr:hypothetical protein [Pseudoalteromonas peptidolytica F12-50-A1]
MLYFCRCSKYNLTTIAKKITHDANTFNHFLLFIFNKITICDLF